MKKSGVFGSAEVRRSFRAMANLYLTPVNQASRFALQPILKAAKQNITDDPELSQSLVIKKDSRSPKAKPMHVVGPDANSPAVRRAHFKEFGTEPHTINGHLHPGEPPRPFLTPAFEQHASEAVKRFGAKMGTALENQAAKLARKQGKA